MTKADVARLLAQLRAAYPRQQISTDTLGVYAEALSDLEPESAGRAIAALIATSRWFPTIAEIRERAVDDALGLPSCAEALSAVTGGVAPHALVKRAVITAWGETWDYNYRTSTMPALMRKQFSEVYADMREREQYRAQTRALLGETGSGLQRLLGPAPKDAA